MSEKELIEALKPFALYAEQMAKQWGHTDACVRYGVKASGAHQVTYGDFRRAANVYRACTQSSQRATEGDVLEMGEGRRCPSCNERFVDGGTCSRGGCPMGGDF